MPTRIFLAALLVLVAAAASPLFAQRGSGDLAGTVADAVRRCPHYTIFDDVTVEVADRSVTLTGEVTSVIKREEIAAEVAKIDGVRNVVNDIDVLPVSTIDSDLRLRLAQAIYGHAAFWQYASMPSPPIHIIVRRGHVRLTGSVNTEVERALAHSLAQGKGAGTIKNEIKVLRGPTGSYEVLRGPTGSYGVR